MYVDSNGNALPIPSRGLNVFFGMSPSDLEKSIANGADIPQGGGIGRKIPFGLQGMYFSVLDPNGVKRHNTEYGWVLSLDPALSALILGILLAAAGWFFGLMCVVFAPYQPAAMLVVDSGFFRQKGTLGFITLALLWSRLRWHILSRYLRHLREDLKGRCGKHSCEQLQSLVSEVVGALSVSPGKSLRGSLEFAGSSVGVIEYGERGLERFAELALAFCDNLELSQSQRASFERLGLRLAIPVCLALPTYLEKGNQDPNVDDLIGGVLGEFANFGDINDPQLGRYLLDQGSFIFFLRDYHELEDLGRHVVQQFINRYKRENIIVIGWNKTEIGKKDEKRTVRPEGLGAEDEP